MYKWFCGTNEDNPDHVCFSDEAHILLSGHVMGKNNVYWGTAPPEVVLQRSSHAAKCRAWIAISKYGIIGPYCFEDENKRPNRVKIEQHVAVRRNL